MQVDGDVNNDALPAEPVSASSALPDTSADVNVEPAISADVNAEPVASAASVNASEPETSVRRPYITESRSPPPLERSDATVRSCVASLESVPPIPPLLSPFLPFSSLQPPAQPSMMPSQRQLLPSASPFDFFYPSAAWPPPPPIDYYPHPAFTTAALQHPSFIPNSFTVCILILFSYSLFFRPKI